MLPGLGRVVAIVALAGLPAAGAAEQAPLPRLGPAPNFALTTQQDDRLWLTQLRDRVVVMTFTCTTCGSCPVMPRLLELTRTVREASGPRVFFVAVSVDPVRDTPPVLRRFARSQGVDLTAWALLTGKASEVDVVTRRYGVEVRREHGGLVHECLVVLIDGAGVVRARYGADEIARLRPDIEALLVEPPRR